MDPLSVTASIVAIITLTGSIIGFLNDLKDPSKERAQSAIEISNVYNLLIQLKCRLDEASSNESWFAKVQALAVLNGPIDQYKSALEELQSKFTSSSSRKRKISGALSWKFCKEDFEGILLRIERLKSLIHFALSIDHFTLSRKTKADTSAIASTVKLMHTDNTAAASTAKLMEENKRYLGVMDWLSPIDFRVRQFDIISKRQGETGQWFIASPKFTSWLQGAKEELFCPGIPGAGKTMMTAIAVDYIQKTIQGDKVGVAYIYNNYNRQEEQTVTKLVASILKQLAQGHQLYRKSVTALHKQHAERGTRPSLEEICTSLNSVLNKYSKAYIIIDALDEYTDSDSTRSKLITTLRSVQASTNTSLMVTSRPDLGTETLFQGIPRLEIHANEADIRQYVAGQVHRLPKVVRNNPELQQEIQDEIAQAVDGMFLLAPLHVDSLVDEITKTAVRSRLKRLPSGSTGVNKAYGEAIERIEKQSPNRSKRAKTVLSWITYAERQLTTTELCHALAVETGNSEFDKDNIPDIEDIISACAGLVTVDEESSIVRLVHYTTQEYFERELKTWNPKAQEEITSTCLTYLSFETFNAGHCNNDEDFESRIEQNPLLDYAARYWGIHAFTIQQEIEIKKLALPFLSNTNQVLCSSQVMFISESRVSQYSQGMATNVTGIHLTAHFRLVYLLQELAHSDRNQTRMQIDAGDSYNQTPLWWAAHRGHEEVVELLVKRDDVAVNSRDYWYKTPLSSAAEAGHEVVMKLLLERNDVIADSKDDNGHTPLSLAAETGREEIVKLLLERDDVVADLKNIEGRTPLYWAAGGGHEVVVKLLVERNDVVADSRDFDGWTPLVIAAVAGHKQIVKLLVERNDVVADAKDYKGRTPLSLAAEEGHEEIVKLLLERDDVDPNSKDNEGRTPLTLAIHRAQEKVAKLLLERDDVNPNVEDKLCYTLLSRAAYMGYNTVAKLLLERDDINPNFVDRAGRTALWLAIERGNEEIVRLLLMRDDIDPNSENNEGHTPLWYARQRKRRHAELLNRTNLNFEWFTGENIKYEAIIKLLTERISERGGIVEEVEMSDEGISSYNDDLRQLLGRRDGGREVMK